MYITIENEQEIRKFQKIFEENLIYDTEIIIRNCDFSIDKEKVKADVYWSLKNGFWYATAVLNGRYWNALGLGKPVGKRPKEECQICFSIKGNTAGSFIKDESTGKVNVKHSGKFRGVKIEPIIVGELTSNKNNYFYFQRKIIEFLEKVKSIKPENDNKKPKRGIIDFNDVKNTYYIWKEVYFNDMKKIDGVKEIYNHSTNPKMSKGSASDYLYDLECFYENKLYCRTQKPEDTVYFLSQLYKEYGDKIYQNALSALEKHVFYYKNRSKNIANTSSVEPLLNVLKEGKLKITEVCQHHDNLDGYFPLDNIKGFSKTEYKRPPSFKKERLQFETNNLQGSLTNNKQTKATLIKKSQKPDKSTSFPTSSNPNDLYSLEYSELFQQIKKLITKINEHGKKGKRKISIFKETGMLGLLDDIEKLCITRESFKSFISSLYILYREKTRCKNNNYRANSDHYYIYSFPDKFWEKDRITKCSMDNIIILRTEYLHSDEEDTDRKTEKKKSFIDVVEEITGKRYIPESAEDFRELQAGVMNQFRDAMEELLNMVKDDL